MFQALIVIEGYNGLEASQPALTSQIIEQPTEKGLEYAIRMISGTFRCVNNLSVHVTRLQVSNPKVIAELNKKWAEEARATDE